MKTAFKILPASAAENPLHLLIEIGWEGISFLYYAADSLKIEAVVIMQAEKNIIAAELAKEIELVLQAESPAEFASCHICYNFKETILVPASYFNESEVAAMMDCVTGIQADSITFTAPVNELNATNIFRVNAAINNILHDKFSAAHFHHTHNLLLPLLQQQQQQFFCIIYHNSIKVILFKENMLQLVQQFEYSTPTDVAYHLLNTCSLHQVSPSEIVLTLSGFIDKDSNLYDELYRYFLNIQFCQLPATVQVTDEMGEMPAHLFSHLISLVPCVL